MNETEGIVVEGATGRASKLILLPQLYLFLLHHLLLLRLSPHSGSSCSAPDQELYLQLPPTSIWPLLPLIQNLNPSPGPVPDLDHAPANPYLLFVLMLLYIQYRIYASPDDLCNQIVECF